MSEENVKTVRQGIEEFQAALARDDPGAMFESGIVAPDAEWIPDPKRAMGLRPVYRGREGFVEFMGTWTEDYFDWSIELERVIDAGDDRVVAMFHQRATGKGSGATVELHMALLFELENGAIIRMRSFVDPGEALEATELRE
jgi:ketosteroid isomerase-like protein